MSAQRPPDRASHDQTPHPLVRGLRAARVELAGSLSGPGTDGEVRRAAVAELVTTALAELWRSAVADLAAADPGFAGDQVAGLALGAVGSVGRGDPSPRSDRLSMRVG